MSRSEWEDLTHRIDGGPTSQIFNYSDSVLSAHPDAIETEERVHFGEDRWRSQGVIRTRRNLSPANGVIDFRDLGPWELPVRELAMILFNPLDPRVREIGLYRGSRPATFGRVRSRVQSFQLAARWAAANAAPTDPTVWSRKTWFRMVEDLVDDGVRRGTIRNLVAAVRDMVEVSPYLTVGPVVEDPWKGMRAAEIARQAAQTPTRVIPPDQWVPLVTAAWKYVSVFADDVLSLRLSHDCRSGRNVNRENPWRRKVGQRNFDDEVLDFVSKYSGPVPGLSRRGEIVVNWSGLSRIVSGGGSELVFKSNQHRRLLVERHVRAGRMNVIVMSQSDMDRATNEWECIREPPIVGPGRARNGSYDRGIQDWAKSKRPKFALNRPASHNEVTEPDVNWSMMERIIFGEDLGQSVLNSSTVDGARRREMVLDVVDRAEIFVADRGLRSFERVCENFVSVTRSDDSVVPWATRMSDYEAHAELRNLRCACYIYIAAMTLMRDSEILEIQRNCLVEYFGEKAIRSTFFKGRKSPTVGFWWVTDEVGLAISVLEQLSLEKSYLFGAYVDDQVQLGRSFYSFGAEIEYFINSVNRVGWDKGLKDIPLVGPVSPRSFRRTSSQILSELGADELSLSRQLKHSISRTRSSVTASYMAPDSRWGEFLSSAERDASVTKFARSLPFDSRGDTVGLSGGGSESLIGKIVDPLRNGGAMVFSEREVVALLKSSVGEIHLGAANACIFDPDRALCLNGSSSRDRPMFGACRPVDCRNSVITPANREVWEQEEADLMRLVDSCRPSDVRRKMLEKRLDDVRKVLRDISGEMDG